MSELEETGLYGHCSGAYVCRDVGGKRLRESATVRCCMDIIKNEGDLSIYHSVSILSASPAG